MANRERISRTVTRITGRRAPVPPTPPVFNPIDAWPVGSMFIGNTATSPATLLGGGTWVRVGQGRTLVGQDPSDVDFDALFEIGGEKAHTLTKSEMPVHNHTMGGVTIPTREGDNISPAPNVNASSYVNGNNRLATSGGTGGTTQNRNYISGPVDNEGGGSSHNNMPPYMVVYFWWRTA